MEQFHPFLLVPFVCYKIIYLRPQNQPLKIYIQKNTDSARYITLIIFLIFYVQIGSISGSEVTIF